MYTLGADLFLASLAALDFMAVDESQSKLATIFRHFLSILRQSSECGSLTARDTALQVLFIKSMCRREIDICEGNMRHEKEGHQRREATNALSLRSITCICVSERCNA